MLEKRKDFTRLGMISPQEGNTDKNQITIRVFNFGAMDSYVNLLKPVDTVTDKCVCKYI